MIHPRRPVAFVDANNGRKSPCGSLLKILGYVVHACICLRPRKFGLVSTRDRVVPRSSIRRVTPEAAAHSKRAIWAVLHGVPNFFARVIDSCSP